MENNILVIDLSTSACKVFVFNLSGRIISQAHRSIPLYHPKPNWVEADARDWWKLAVECIREVLEEVDTNSITAVGMCGLMHALLPVDEKGKPLDRVMLWMDQRCRPQCDWLQEHAGRLSRITGRKPSTTVSAPKLRWIVENRRDVLVKTYKFMFGKDFIRMKLTGEYATDISDARGTALLDDQKKQWSYEVLDLIGISKDKMLPIMDSADIIGFVTGKASRETGLRDGTPVVIGASDVQGTFIGINMYTPGRTCLYMGTAAWIVTCPESGSRDWIGSTATWGASLNWCKKTCNDSRAFSDIDKAASKINPASDGIIFIPHLMGERGPKHNPYAKGVIFGLTLAHTSDHITRSVLEGNAYLIRHIIEEYGIDRIGSITAAGGGAKSLLWCKIISSVLNKDMHVPRVKETTALGAAIITAVGTGFVDSLEKGAEKWVEISHIIKPDPDIVTVYNKSYSLYRRIDACMEEFYPEVLIEYGS
ncbi:hypothetical protein GF312_19200 [Candidatus Poribacteria bacterium]|nr:hypothetical protein [Candidatus Poribacteria bacterium]